MLFTDLSKSQNPCIKLKRVHGLNEVSFLYFLSYLGAQRSNPSQGPSLGTFVDHILHFRKLPICNVHQGSNPHLPIHTGFQVYSSPQLFDQHTSELIFWKKSLKVWQDSYFKGYMSLGNCTCRKDRYFIQTPHLVASLSNHQVLSAWRATQVRTVSTAKGRETSIAQSGFFSISEPHELIPT